MKYKYILCDADDTLLDFAAAERAAFGESLSDFGASFSDEIYSRYHVINDEYWKLLELGKTTREELKIARFATLFSETGILSEDAACDFAISYVDNLSHNCVIFPGVIDTLGRLAKDYDIYIITNGLKISQHGRLDNSPVMDHCKGLFISEEIGAAKPSVEFFDYVINTIGDHDLSKYIVVGDSPSSDIKGAAGYGLDSCFVSNGREYTDHGQTYTIKSFNDITDIL